MRNAAPSPENPGPFLGECAGSGLVWEVIALRGEGDRLPQAVSLLFVFCPWISPHFK